jgi:hypothetical protein
MTAVDTGTGGEASTKQQRKEEQQRREAAEEQLQNTTLAEFLNACHLRGLTV